MGSILRDVTLIFNNLEKFALSKIRVKANIVISGSEILFTEEMK